MNREHGVPQPKTQINGEGLRNAARRNDPIMNGTGDKGCCPSCQLALPVGIACTERGCTVRGYHGIPNQDASILDPRTSDAAIGTKVDEYLIVGLLGAGGFGKVFRALQTPIMMPTALKLMHAHMKNEAHFEVLLRKFQGEAQALATLSHPNIVRLLKYGLHAGSPYLVMEMVEGARTLKDEIGTRAIQGIALESSDALHILRQCTDAMEAAHTRNIVHRDIKPENIMLQEVAGNPNFVRILDFGLAKFVAESSETSVAMGTPSYMAPEQLSRKNIGPWTDLYALGVVAFELLTGRRPFEGDTHQEIILRKLDPGFNPLSLVKDQQLPDVLTDFLQRALERDPEKRYRSTYDFRAALERVAQTLQRLEQSSQLSTDLTALLDSSKLSLLETKRRQLERERRKQRSPNAHPLTPKEAAATTAPPGIQIDDRALEPDTTLPKGNSDTIAVTPTTGSASASNRIAIVASVVGLLFIGGAVAIGMSMGGSTHEAVESGATVQSSESTPTSQGDVDPLKSVPLTVATDADTSFNDTSKGTPSDALERPLTIPSSMVLIPAGTYKLGCKGDGCDRDYQRSFEEKRVYRSVGLMRHEVTTAEYFACVKNGLCARPRRESGCHTDSERVRQRPINCVSFKDAKRFCEAQGDGWRLPTDAEWEIAARGENQRTYPWGTAPPTCDLTSMKSADGKGCGTRGALNVGSKPKDTSWCGASDLAGNVSEWTGTFNEDGSPYIRGASFLMGSSEIFDSSIRQAESPTLRRVDIGFRCAMDIN